MSITIRHPLSGEYSLLIQLWGASVRATHHFLVEEDIQFYRPLIAKYLPIMAVYCAVDNEDLLGFIGINEQMIHALFIHPDARGKGVGKKLVEYAVMELGATKVDVNEQNQQALGFYEYLGFRVVSRSEQDGAGKPYPILNMELNYALSKYIQQAV